MKSTHIVLEKYDKNIFFSCLLNHFIIDLDSSSYLYEILLIRVCSLIRVS